ncbi:hypothetical protein DSO57_1020488 [Entomophthora muscae]|uniref:Uncharacterized protein n=1 Tax=Entomophthora muscae TaxID=34485 RepID=A0ACC2UNJ6_9FUNG|nr:hypothetical protein DSO57_1020488 [Entomophthora muscae]
MGVQARHHMEVRDLVACSNHQQEYQAALRLNTLLEQLNTQLLSIVGEILDLRGASQSWYCNVNRHILALEHYVEDAAH